MLVAGCGGVRALGRAAVVVLGSGYYADAKPNFIAHAGEDQQWTVDVKDRFALLDVPGSPYLATDN